MSHRHNSRFKPPKRARKDEVRPPPKRIKTVIKTDDVPQLCEKWLPIRRGIEKIFEKQKLSSVDYMEMHSKIHEYCSSTENGPPTQYQRRVNKWGTGDFTGEKLYKQIKDFIRQYLRNMDNIGLCFDGEDFLQYHLNSWVNYQKSCKLLDGVCTYLNRYCLRTQCEEGNRGVFGIYQLTMICWARHMLKFTSDRLIKIILYFINEDRKGKSINTELLRTVLQSIVDVGIHDNDVFSKKECLKVYQALFECVFLSETQEFYIIESAKFLKTSTVTEYMITAETVIEQEKRRAEAYLHPTTIDPLIKLCEKVLIIDRLEIFRSNFKTLLVLDDLGDIERVYRLLKSIPGSLEDVFDIFEEYATKAGLDAIESVATKAISTPILYLETILHVYKRCHEIITVAFGTHHGFKKALDKGCCTFVNHNAITDMENFSSAKSPELVVKATDLLLRRSNKNKTPAEIEAMLEDIMTIFNFIEDKDLFQAHYSKLLAKRLVQQSSSSHDAEASMIEKLKFACGMEYTAKLQRMFADISISKDLNEKFRKQLTIFGATSDLEFNIFVLTYGAWPFQQVLTLSLPREMQNKVTAFTDLYNRIHTGRTLKWLHQVSTGELVANCFKNRYTFQATTFQMAVLLHYNRSDTFTVLQLEEITQISHEYLMQVLNVLVKSKILVCEDDESSLAPTSVLRLNLGYKNKKPRVNLNIPMKIDVKADQEFTKKFIEEDRHMLVQAAIVRVLKSKRTIQHQQLIAAVFEELSSQFTPTVVVIKKCIDLLIQKEYIERKSKNSDIYQYLS